MNTLLKIDPFHTGVAWCDFENEAILTLAAVIKEKTILACRLGAVRNRSTTDHYMSRGCVHIGWLVAWSTGNTELRNLKILSQIILGCSGLRKVTVNGIKIECSESTILGEIVD